MSIPEEQPSYQRYTELFPQIARLKKVKRVFSGGELDIIEFESPPRDTPGYQYLPERIDAIKGCLTKIGVDIHQVAFTYPENKTPIRINDDGTQTILSLQEFGVQNMVESFGIKIGMILSPRFMPEPLYSIFDLIRATERKLIELGANPDDIQPGQKFHIQLQSHGNYLIVIDSEGYFVIESVGGTFSKGTHLEFIQSGFLLGDGIVTARVVSIKKL